jgi:hypothetical protein
MARWLSRCRSLGEYVFDFEAVRGIVGGGGLSAGCLSGDERKLKRAFMIRKAQEGKGQEGRTRVTNKAHMTNSN